MTLAPNHTAAWWPVAPTVRAWLAAATDTLRAAGIGAPRVAAEWLLQEALGVDRVWLCTHGGDTLPPTVVSRLTHWLARCGAHEPVAYIVGYREFWGREFSVSPAVLVPRPETEHLVEAALAIMPAPRTGDVVRVCDVGTGSGCVAVSLACEWPAAQIVATDISAAALEVARANAYKHGVTARIACVRADVLEPFAGASFDLVVANPPYLSHTELATAPPELHWEPRIALDGGVDGLAIIRRLIHGSPRVLRPNGWLLMEIGGTQSAAVVRLLQHAGARTWFVRRDLAGWPRVVGAQW